MKKYLVLFLAFCVILVGCGSAAETTTKKETEAVSTPMTFEQLQDKYKRADWDSFTDDPLAFIDDFKRSFSMPIEEWGDLSTFEHEEDDFADSYKKDVVFFNQAFTMRVSVWKIDGNSSGALTYNGPADQCYSSYEKIVEAMFNTLGDAEEIEMDYEIVDEATLRKAISSGLTEENIEISWSYKTTPTGFSYGAWVYSIGEEGTIYIY